MKLKLAAALVAGVILGSGGVAVAATTATVISACRHKTTGVLRIPAAGKRCTKSETAVSWNVKGQAGARGATGPAGPTGAPAPAGSIGALPLDRLRTRETSRSLSIPVTINASDWKRITVFEPNDYYALDLTKTATSSPCLANEQTVSAESLDTNYPHPDEWYFRTSMSTDGEIAITIEEPNSIATTTGNFTFNVKTTCRSFYLEPTT
jgi:hypothetical protein